MLNVTRGDKTFDLEGVATAIGWAYDRAMSMDAANAAKNCSGSIIPSPITQALIKAADTIAQLRLTPVQIRPPDVPA